MGNRWHVLLSLMLLSPTAVSLTSGFGVILRAPFAFIRTPMISSLFIHDSWCRFQLIEWNPWSKTFWDKDILFLKSSDLMGGGEGYYKWCHQELPKIREGIGLFIISYFQYQPWILMNVLLPSLDGDFLSAQVMQVILLSVPLSVYTGQWPN